MHLLDSMRIEINVVPGMPRFVSDQLQYLVYSGSMAYGVSNMTSDMDCYGFCIPPKQIIFPHLGGHIQGFGTKPQSFEQYQQHHIHFKGNDYDLSVYNIVKFFQLVMENNPNMVDVLFVPQNCILHITPIGQHVRDNRKLFLHKGAYHKFRGYAYSQLHKMQTKNPTGSRKDKLIDGYDFKFGYHLVRLLRECEQILSEGDLDLTKNSNELKYIRSGAMSFEELKTLFETDEKRLTSLYDSSKLPYGPDEEVIKRILLECLEMHFGSLGSIVVDAGKANNLIGQIKNLILEKGF